MKSQQFSFTNWRFPKQSLLVCVFLFVLTGQVLAESFDDAQSAYVAGKYAKAAVLFRSLAEQGDVAVQIRLAEMYETGKGVLQDYKESMKWTRLAAEHGDAFAQPILGVMYKDGQGVPRDYELAHMWQNIAATSEDSITYRKSYTDLRDSIARLNDCKANCKGA